MELLITLGVIFIVLAIKGIYDKKTYRRKLDYRLKKEWGDVPKQIYSQEKKESIKFFYKSRKKGGTNVDNITWHDLDMDQVYMTINSTCSAVGEEYLYAMLRQPVFDQKELDERERLIELFSEDEEKRRTLQRAFAGMGKMKTISVYEYMHRLNDVPRESNMGHIMQIIGLLICIATIFVQPMVGIIATIAVICYNMATYFKRKNVIEAYFNVVSYILRWLDSAQEVGKSGIPEIKNYSDELAEIVKHFRSFRNGASVVASKSSAGDLLQMFIDYIRMMFHIDLIKFNSMLDVFADHSRDFNRMFEIVGYLDSMIAIASFRELMVEYCVPSLESGGKAFIEAENLYHPMINDPVKNNISETRCSLITGSNASGKSTFIKTLAINAILAQSINTVMADSYHSSFFRVSSSMALQDNLKDGESYYIVEIKSLKRILDGIREDVPTLCFVDEVLRGTNTLERIAASSQILYGMARKNAICFAATHDIELTYILEDYYSNYHFQERVEKNRVLFDYKLHEGRAVSRNAIKLLKMLGYTDDIIDTATNAANVFLETGEWPKIGEIH